jgi:hypothetical protein
MVQTIETAMSHGLEPACPRDNHRMHFEEKGISWKATPNDRRLQTLPSYHCSFEGCSVRYDLLNGYFSVVRVPDQPYFIEEPGINVLRCPRHGTWLYRKTNRDDDAYDWRCGVEGCSYIHPRDS